MSTDKFLVVKEGQQLPNLHTDAEPVQVDLVSDYWSPESEGESKRVFFIKIDESDARDQQTNQPITLDCAFFLEQKPDGSTAQIRNGSKRLVGAIEKNNIIPGTALEIRYMGKKKNKTNGNISDHWSIRPLQPKAQ